MGVVVAKWLVEKVVGVERYSDERYSDVMMKVNGVIRDAVWEVSCCCSHTERYATKKEFYEFLNNAVTSEKVLLRETLMVMLTTIWIDLEKFTGVLYK